ncbi:MAG: DUF1002 domain-containing protein [Firmicutes bacterium]|nr:DUF1002 domain-containing protein [Bacillota bacterium]
MKSKRTIAIILSLVMAFTMSFTGTVFAAEGDEYLALGADLSSSEKSTVLSLLGVDNVDNYNVIYVTNAEEHKYLDGYVDSAQIGSKALSSIKLRETGGDSTTVELHNIGYCTEGMYVNALETAGVSGAEVVVAGPFTISGTAALVGIIKAYEEMTGEDISDEVVEGAVDEMTTTGELGEEIGNMEAAGDIIAAVKEQLADNPDMSDAELEQAIQEAAADAGYQLSDENVQKIKDMLSNLKGLNIDWGKIKDVLNSDQAQGFLQKIIDWFKNLIG